MKKILDRSSHIKIHADVDLEAAKKSSSAVTENDPISVLPLLKILQGQAAWTEFRGGLFTIIIFY